MLKKSLLGLALATAFSASAYAGNVTELTITNGLFQFGSAPTNDANQGEFTTDIGPIDATQANAAGSFSTGFEFFGNPFVPYTSGPIDATIAGDTITVASFPFGGAYAGTNFDLPASDVTGTADEATGAYSFDYSSTITTGNFKGLTAFFHIEGVATTEATVIPVPAAVWLLGSGLVGLAGVARRRKAKQG